MYIFLSVEAQNCSESELSEILRSTKNELSFLTENAAVLEKLNNYGTEFCGISIIPSCMDDTFWNSFGWKERIQIWRKKKEADIRLRMDYERFITETPENKRLLFIDIIIKSIQAVQERSKGDFKGNELINDILSTLKVTKEDLKKIENSLPNRQPQY